MKTSKPRFGLLAKIILFLAAVLIPLAAVTWYISVQTLRRQMTEEFTSKGSAIANTLASSGVELVVTRDEKPVARIVGVLVVPGRPMMRTYSSGGSAHVRVRDLGDDSTSRDRSPPPLSQKPRARPGC